MAQQQQPQQQNFIPDFVDAAQYQDDGAPDLKGVQFGAFQDTIDRIRPDNERLIDIVGSRSKKDISFNSALANKKGALLWASKQGKDKEGNQKYFVYDHDLDDDGVPEIAIRDKNGNLYSVNGYRTKQSDFFMKNRYLDEFPDRADRAQHPYDEWVNEYFGVQPEDSGLRQKITKNQDKWNTLKASGYRTHISEEVSPLRVFTANVVVKVLNAYLLSLFNVKDHGNNIRLNGAKVVTDKHRIAAVRTTLGLSPTATSAIANKAFYYLVNRPIMQHYREQYNALGKKMLDKYKAENQGQNPDMKEFQIKVYKRFTSKKAVKEAQKSMLRGIANGSIKYAETLKKIILEAIAGDFKNVWGEPVKVKTTERGPSPYANWQDDDYNEYYHAMDDDARTLHNTKRRAAYDFLNEAPGVQ